MCYLEGTKVEDRFDIKLWLLLDKRLHLENVKDCVRYQAIYFWYTSFELSPANYGFFSRRVYPSGSRRSQSLISRRHFVPISSHLLLLPSMLLEDGCKGSPPATPKLLRLAAP